jgi:hypothetical protein
LCVSKLRKNGTSALGSSCLGNWYTSAPSVLEASSDPAGALACMNSPTSFSLDGSGTNMVMRNPAPKRRLRRSDVPTACTWPWLITAILSASKSTSSMACDVSTMTRPTLASEIICSTSARVTGSMPVVGSSRNTMSGSPSKAMAMDSRRRMPPEYPPQAESPALCNLTWLMRFWASAFTSPRKPLIVANISRCSRAVICGNKTSCCGHTPITECSWDMSPLTDLPKISASPEVTLVSPVSALNVVDLPDPLCPSKANSEFWGMLYHTLFTALNFCDL